MMPRHGVVETSRIALSMTIILETAPVKAANSTSSWRSANAGAPARQYISWDRGTKRQPQRTQAGVSCTRPPPLAALEGTGGGYRAGGCAGSAAGTVSYLWRLKLWGGRRSQHRGVRGGWARGVGLWRAIAGLYFVFLGGARHLELSPCNTPRVQCLNSNSSRGEKVISKPEQGMAGHDIFYLFCACDTFCLLSWQAIGFGNRNLIDSTDLIRIQE